MKRADVIIGILAVGLGLYVYNLNSRIDRLTEARDSLRQEVASLKKTALGRSRGINSVKGSVLDTSWESAGHGFSFGNVTIQEDTTVVDVNKATYAAEWGPVVRVLFEVRNESDKDKEMVVFNCTLYDKGGKILASQQHLEEDFFAGDQRVVKQEFAEMQRKHVGKFTVNCTSDINKF